MSLQRSTLVRANAFRPTTCSRATSILRPTAALESQSHPLSTSSSLQSCPASQTSIRARQQTINASLPITSARNASTSTDAAPSSSSPAAPTQPVLNWNEFLRLRRIRRYFNLGGSVTMGVGGLVSGAGILATEDIGGWGAQMFGLDPLVIMGIFTTGCAGMGWLLGPLVGTSVFKMFYRRFGTQMRVKERDFFERVKRYRVDPTSSSMSNPVPDYYGEKITSVAGYRRWLKDQRAFNKKRQSFV